MRRDCGDAREYVEALVRALLAQPDARSLDDEALAIEHAWRRGVLWQHRWESLQDLAADVGAEA